jgi:uncharacterized phage-associated protein
MGVTTASDVADFILEKSTKEISNLKLQKLLYYCQAWHLALYDRPLFADSIEAWLHGPVVPSIYRQFKKFGWQPIKRTGHPCAQLDDNAQAHVGEILKLYGDFNAVALEQMTHEENPWAEARASLSPDANPSKEIPHTSMNMYFKQVLHGAA